MNWALDMDVHEHLVVLLRFAGRFSLDSVLHSAASGGAGPASCHPTAADLSSPVSLFVPSNGQLAAAILALCCAVTFEHQRGKHSLATAAASTAAVLAEGQSHSRVAAACSTPSSSTRKTNGSSSSSSSSEASGSGSGRGKSSPSSFSTSSSSSHGNGSLSNSSSTLHQLLSLGLARSITPSARWLCLGIAGSLLAGGCQGLGSPALKTTIVQMLSLALQKSVHSGSADPEATVHLLNALTSLLSVTDDGTADCLQLSHKDITNAAGMHNFQLSAGLLLDFGGTCATAAAGGGGGGFAMGSPSGGSVLPGTDSSVVAVGSVGGCSSGAAQSKQGYTDFAFKLVAFPELMQWVWNAAGSRRDVAAAVCRCIGQLSRMSVPGKDKEEQELDDSCTPITTVRAGAGVGSGAGAAGKVGLLRRNQHMAHLITEAVLGVLSEGYHYTEQKSPSRNRGNSSSSGAGVAGGMGGGDSASEAGVVRVLATLALWNILHHSEKAKQRVRGLLHSVRASIPPGGKENTANVACYSYLDCTSSPPLLDDAGRYRFQMGADDAHFDSEDGVGHRVHFADDEQQLGGGGGSGGVATGKRGSGNGSHLGVISTRATAAAAAVGIGAAGSFPVIDPASVHKGELCIAAVMEG